MFGEVTTWDDKMEKMTCEMIMFDYIYTYRVPHICCLKFSMLNKYPKKGNIPVKIVVLKVQD